MIKQNAACLPAAPNPSMSKSEKLFELSALCSEIAKLLTPPAALNCSQSNVCMVGKLKPRNELYWWISI